MGAGTDNVNFDAAQNLILNNYNIMECLGMRFQSAFIPLNTARKTTMIDQAVRKGEWFSYGMSLKTRYLE